MGDVIAGRFELLDVLARGGTSSVWRARDHKFQVLCAAKVLRQRDSADLLRFVREQSITSDHPHLLTPYGWAAEDATVVIAMPLAAGGTVADAIADFGAFGPNLAATILDQVLQGLAELHQADWVHRDVKPANLMFPAPTTGRPRVQLADFGLALHREDVRFTHTGMVHGTDGFIAPEVLLGGPVDLAQDVYAAAVTTLQMLAPDEPLPVEAALPHLPEVPAGFLELLAAMLTAEPGERPTAQAARDRLSTMAGLLDRPWLSADGEPFEVFDQLDPLPPDTPAGSVGSATGSVTPTSPSPLSPGPDSDEPLRTANTTVQPRDLAPDPAAPPGPGAPERGTLLRASSQISGLDSSRGPDPNPRRRRRGLTTAVMSLIALLAGLALVLASVLPQTQQVPAEPPPSPGQPAEEDATEDDGSENPAGDEAEPQEPVDPDQECSWVEENTTRSADDGGTLTCVRQDDGSYAWQ